MSQKTSASAADVLGADGRGDDVAERRFYVSFKQDLCTFFHRQAGLRFEGLQIVLDLLDLLDAHRRDRSRCAEHVAKRHFTNRLPLLGIEPAPSAESHECFYREYIADIALHLLADRIGY